MLSDVKMVGRGLCYFLSGASVLPGQDVPQAKKGIHFFGVNGARLRCTPIVNLFHCYKLMAYRPATLHA